MGADEGVDMKPDAEAVQGVAQVQGGPGELVAIIGLGAVMPDADDLPTFWSNIQAGRNSIRDVDPARWDPAVHYDPDPGENDLSYTKIGAFIEDVKFNPLEYRIPPKVAQQLDEVQQMTIKAVAEAFKDAGYDQKEFDRERCAIILGNAMGGERQRATTGRILAPAFLHELAQTEGFQALPKEQQEKILAEYQTEVRQRFPEINEDTMPGELSNIVAGRIANVFNLSGQNYTTDAACASSLAAIDSAVKALLNREADMVLTGGADRSMDISTYVKFCKIGALSSKGSFPFDARADGFVMGEGAGILLLKRLDDALRDGDKVYAVVRGVGSSSDGKGKGITAPNLDGQVKAIQRALEHAKIDPATVGLIECHGTSTRVGDVVEVEALTRIFGDAAAGSIAIGSVKSQIGHLKSAAGAAGLLKATMALKEQKLPPSINFETPNPKIDWDNTPFFVNTQTQDWPAPPGGGPRRAAVSSFGFGGTNFHVILEEYVPGVTVAPAATESTTAAAPQHPSEQASVAEVVAHATVPESQLAYEEPPEAAATEVLLVGADNPQEMAAQLKEVAGALASGAVNGANFAHYCWVTSQANVGKPLRLAIVSTGPEDLSKKLEMAPQALEAEGAKRMFYALKGLYVGQGERQGKLAFLFPGQGSQYVDMLRDLGTRFERIRQTFAEANEVMVPFLDKELTRFIFSDDAGGTSREDAEDALRRTEICQPAVLASDLGLYRLLGDYSIRPDMVAGHSLGEYGATVASGIMTLKESMVAVSARGREMANVHVPDLGKMASVGADPETVGKALENVEGYVIPANKNCKVQTVIAGSSDAVDQAVKMFQEMDIQAMHINVSAAFHSEIVAPARAPFRKVLERMDIRAPKIPILCNVNADYYPTGGEDVKAQILDLLTTQIAAPVEWQRQIERLYDDGARFFVEVGPKKTLTTFCHNILEGKPFVAVATNHPKKGGFWHFQETVAALAAWGYPVRFPNPLDASVSTPAFREGRVEYSQPSVSAARPATEPIAAAAAPTASVGSNGGVESRVAELGLNLDRLLVTGISVGTPGRDKDLFSDDNFDRILRGDNHIDRLEPDQRRRMVAKNIVRLVKSSSGDARFETIHDLNEVIALMGQAGRFDLGRDYGIDQDLIEALDVTSAYAIAAALEALRDAGVPLVQSVVKTTTGKYLPGSWVLPVPLQEETGVVFASAFPGYNNLVDTISRFFARKYGKAQFGELADIYADVLQRVRDPDVREALTEWYTDHFAELKQRGGEEELYTFNRRFLFQVLSMGHAQVAQLLKAKGPNTQVNSACASTSVALASAEDWIRTGRCKRVIVVAADDATSPAMAEWIGSGFLAAGAATTKEEVAEAALPFDRRRHGMIIGMGAVGLVVEAESEVKARGQEGIVEMVATHIANSAYHGSRLDTEHVAQSMDDLMTVAERRLGVQRSELAQNMLFMSHETYTPARGGSAAAEILALRTAFGKAADKIVVTNTKGFTGHPQGASIEDAIAIRALQKGRAPPIANLKEPDPELGDLNLSGGGEYDIQYALRLAAGFGSQVGITLFKLRSKDAKRIVDNARYEQWLRYCSGQKAPELEVVNRTLRIKSTFPPGVMTEDPTANVGVLPAEQPGTAPAAPRPKEPEVAPEPAIVAQSARDGESQSTKEREEIETRLITLFAQKTGYPEHMLEPDLELEADLGIDTVKQAELFGMVRESYDLPQEDGLQLKDYPTLNAIVDYLHSRLGGTEAPAAAVTQPPATKENLPEQTQETAPTQDGTPADEAAVLKRLVRLFAQKTGYPEDMLETDLDLEADLGIDTVKQAEIFGEVRESYGLPLEEDLQLKDYPTLDSIAGYIHSRLAGSGSLDAQKMPEPKAVAKQPSSAAEAAVAAPAGAAEKAGRDEVLGRLVDLFAGATGYPKEMLETDLDLEADLGIDTVKQAEIFGQVRESYGLPLEEDLQLKDYPTLDSIADYIHQRLGAASPAAPQTQADPAPREPPASGGVADAEEPAETATTVPVAPDAPKSPERDTTVERVRALIAEKTGYPADLLEEELDLEADLGIDTVKQAEIFGDVREAFGIPAIEGLQLSDYPTLGRVADFVLAYQGGDLEAPLQATADDTREETTPTSEEPAPAVGDKSATDRFVVRYTDIGKGGKGENVVKGKVLLALGETQSLKDAVAAAGGVLVALESPPGGVQEAAEAVSLAAEEHGHVDGIVYAAPADGDAAVFDAEGTSLIKGTFYLLKAVLGQGGPENLTVFGVATRMGGDFGATSQDPFPVHHGAMAGLAKAVKKEMEHASVKAVDFPAAAAADEVAKGLVEELGRDGFVEVGTLGGRGTLKLAPLETTEESTGVEWADDDVVLVPGGAQGITAEIVKALAAAHGTRFILLGRTELVEGVEALATLDEDGLAAKKTEIMDSMKAAGGRVTPVMVEKEFSKIVKSIEIHQTVEAVQAAGGDALYVPCDVTDPASVAKGADLGRKLFGPITGILHAAGVEESKLIVDKTPESFDRVFDVKLVGAQHLLEATADDPVRFFVGFASVAGRFGNAGQADYSAANDALAKLAVRLSRDRGPEFRAVTIDWSAWGGKGMATRGSIMKVLEAAGVQAIPLEAGVARCLDEFAHGMDSPEVVVAAGLGQLASDDLFLEAVAPTIPSDGDSDPVPAEAGAEESDEGGQQVLVVEEKPKGATASGALVDRFESVAVARSVATVVLDPDADPYLDDHSIDGTPVFPGTFGVECFVETAAPLCEDLHFVGVRDVQFHLPWKSPRRRRVEATVTAEVATRHDDGVVDVACRLESQFVNARGVALGEPKLHFEGVVRFAPEPLPETMEAAPATTADVDHDRVYARFFHGPSFQVINELGRPDETTSVATYAWPDAPALRQGDEDFVTAPLVREFLFQAAGAHELFQNERMALPHRIGKSRFYGAPRAGEKVTAVATFKKSTDTTGVYDVVAVGHDGRVLERLEGFELIVTGDAPPDPGATSTAPKTFRARWGHDLPIPLPGAHAVLVNDDEISELGLESDACLTSGERKDQERYRNDKRAREFFLGRLAAKEAVALVLDRPVKEARGVEVRRLETGEPQVASAHGTDVLVSISHHGPYAVAVAVPRSGKVRGVGIDLDLVEEKPEAFETQSFTPAERKLLDEMVAGGLQRSEAQLRLWTVKESVLKALGQGFAVSLTDVVITQVDEATATVELKRGAAEALAELKSEAVEIETWTRDNYAYALAWIH